MLSYAAAFENVEEITSWMAHTLIEYAAPVVSVRDFLVLVQRAIGIDTKTSAGFDLIPNDIREALRQNEYSEAVADGIMELNDDVLEALIVFVASEVQCSLHGKFRVTIIRKIYDEMSPKLLPYSLVFAFMALCLRDPIEIIMTQHLAGASTLNMKELPGGLVTVQGFLPSLEMLLGIFDAHDGPEKDN